MEGCLVSGLTCLTCSTATTLLFAPSLLSHIICLGSGLSTRWTGIPFPQCPREYLSHLLLWQTTIRNSPLSPAASLLRGSLQDVLGVRSGAGLLLASRLMALMCQFQGRESNTQTPPLPHTLWNCGIVLPPLNSLRISFIARLALLNAHLLTFCPSYEAILLAPGENKIDVDVDTRNFS